MSKLVTKAKARVVAKRARQPKPGSSRSNQVAGRPVTKPNADMIITVVAAQGGNGMVASSATKNVIIAPWQDNATTRQLAVKGGSLGALRDHLATLVKPTAKLARGVDGHNSPQSAKAVADQRREESKAAPAPKGKAPKSEKNKAPSKGANRTYKPGKTKNEARPDSWRHHLISVVQANTSTDAAKAAHAKSKKFPANKLDFNFCAAKGYIIWVK